MTTPRTYTEDDIAKALGTLRANRGNAKKTALELGISRTTVRSWAAVAAGKVWQGSTGQPKKASDAATSKAVYELGEKWLEVARLAVDRATDILKGDREKGYAADVRNLLVGGAVATEKQQLLSGNPTSRAESVRVQLMEPGALTRASLRVIEGNKAV